MKPNYITSEKTRGNNPQSLQPITGYNFQAPFVGGSCGKPSVTQSTTFWRFSRDYFGAECDRNFRTEAAVFAVLAIAAAAPIIQNASAMSALVRTFGVA